MRACPLIAALLAVASLAACDDGKKQAQAAQIVKKNPGAAAVWPALLQHCMRSPSCDPMSNFGQGVGQASGQSGSTAWFVETKDVVKEGGEDYGAALTLSVFGLRGIGGEAGRPLTLDETSTNLRGTNARRSRLWIEYRTPGGGAPEPYFLAFRSAEVAVTPKGAEAAKTQEELMELTGAHFAGLNWGPEQDGVRIDISDKKGPVFTGYSIGIASGALVEEKVALSRRFEPWSFYLSQNVRDEPAAKLLAALKKGDPLTLSIIVPGGAVVLQDTIYADGFADALVQAEGALKDAAIAKPLSDRCEPVKDKGDEFWLLLDVTPALLACDPRTPEQRRADEADAAKPQ